MILCEKKKMDGKCRLQIPTAFIIEGGTTMKIKAKKTRENLIRKMLRRRKAQETAGKPTGFYPRHLARSIAKANMRKAGVQHVNRNFALNWKNWVTR